MSSLIQDWHELRRAWKRFAAALLSISADDLAKPEWREVTRLTEERTRCPVLSAGVMADPKAPVTELDCIQDRCEWWLELPLPVRANGEHRYVRGCTFKLLAMLLHSVSLAVWDRCP